MKMRCSCVSFLSQPEVLHMIFMRILQKVYGIRLEHFCVVGLYLQSQAPGCWLEELCPMTEERPQNCAAAREFTKVFWLESPAELTGTSPDGSPVPPSI